MTELEQVRLVELTAEDAALLRDTASRRLGKLVPGGPMAVAWLLGEAGARWPDGRRLAAHRGRNRRGAPAAGGRVSTVDPLQGLPCPNCQGRGQTTCHDCTWEDGVRWIECPECDGEGEYECDNCTCGTPHNTACMKCRGLGGHYCEVCVSGMIACVDCEGTGQLRHVRDSQDPAQLAIEVSP